MTTLIQGQLTVTIHRQPETAVDYVEIGGDADLNHFRALGLAARELLEAQARVIYVDLGGVASLRSVLIGFLLQIATTKSATDRELVLCRPTPTDWETIQLCGLDRVARTRADLPADWPVIASDDAVTAREPIGRLGRTAAPPPCS